MSLKTGFDLPHSDTAEAIHIESIMTSALVTFTQTVQHDNELMFYHHIFMQLAVEAEEAETIDMSEISAMLKTIIGSNVDSIRFYKDVADVYNCLDKNGLAAKMEKLWTSLTNQQPLSPESAQNPTLLKVIERSTEYYNLIKSGRRTEALEMAQEQADNFCLGDLLNEEQMQAYIEETLAAESAKEDISLDVYEDGFVQCMCSFCAPRITAWEALREQGQIPHTTEVQNMMIGFLDLDLREIINMTSSSSSSAESPSSSDLSSSSLLLEFE